VAPDLPTFADGLAAVEVMDCLYGLSKITADSNG
jgi:hypothetical protein